MAKGGDARAKREASTGGRIIEHVVVLGANGTMGYGSAALFTHAAPRVTFLARSRDKARQGLEAAQALVRSPTVADRAEVGSYEEDLERAVADADLIFEAVTEKLDLKQRFFDRIDACRRETSIVATVTSGLSIDQLAEGRSASFRKHFLGLHFFNPPNVIVGTELIAGRDTDPQIVDFVERYATRRLGREVVRTSDTPGFAGNRIGFKVLNEAAQLAEEHGPLLVDRLVGPYTGRALPPLATVDLVGWDIHQAIVDNIYDNAQDEARATLRMPGYMRRLSQQGVLGRKSGRGFFARDGKRKLVLVPDRRDWVPVEEVKLPDLSFVERVTELQRVGDYRGALRAFAEADGALAAVAHRVVAGYVSYAFHRAGEVTQSIDGIDRIMGFGFNWAPPSVLVDFIGADALIGMMERSDVPVPRRLEEIARSRSRVPLFQHPNVNVGKYFVAA